jgi:ABC-type amino acid transport substrate-binding protein
MAAAVAAPFDSPLQAEGRSELAQAAASRSLVYGGDSQFPPYEYLDEDGAPAGFNIHLIRALAREAGMSIDVRLGPRDERM